MRARVGGTECADVDVLCVCAFAGGGDRQSEREREESLPESRDAVSVSLVPIRYLPHVSVKAPPNYSPSTPVLIHSFLLELVVSPIWYENLLSHLDSVTIVSRVYGRSRCSQMQRLTISDSTRNPP